MVVAHLGVVEHATRARGRRLQQRRCEPRVVGQRGQRPEQLGQLLRHVAREVARVRPRVGEDLVSLVQRLGGAERRRRRQAKTPVGRPLQRGEIEQQRRRLAHAFLPQPLDHGAVRPARRALAPADDLLRQGARSEARTNCFAVRQRDTPGGGHLLGGLAGRPLGREQAAHLPVVTWPELPDLQLPPHEDRQRRRLHAADRIERRVALSTLPAARRVRRARSRRGGPRAHRDGAGGVHADEPVGLRAAARGAGERVELDAGSQPREARPDRLVGEGGDPEALDRKAAARQLIDVAKDELTLTASVAGVHHLGEAPIAQQLRHGTQLIARARDGPQLEGGGQHGKGVEPPRLPGRIVGGRLLELDEVADAPGDDPPRAVDGVLASAAHADDARQIARDGWFLGDDELHGRPQLTVSRRANTRSCRCLHGHGSAERAS